MKHFPNLSGLFELWDASCHPEGTPVPPPQPGFSGASVLRIETARGAMAVRGWPNPGLPRRRIEELHRLLEHVSASVPVPVPLVASCGNRLVEWNGQLWQLEPWMPGVADFRDNPSHERLSEAMRTLARFHRSAREFVSVGEADEWFGSRDSMRSPAVTERLEQLADCEGRWSELVIAAHQAVTELGELEEQGGWSTLIQEIDSLFRRGSGWIGDQLRMVETTTFDCQPCLRDVWHDHLLWTGEQVTGLVDPGSCRIDNVAIDLARLLGSLVQDDPQGWNRGLSAYEREAGLSLEEAGLVTVLDQSGVLLAGAVWVERLAGRRVASGSADSVMQRLCEVVARMRTLVERIGTG